MEQNSASRIEQFHLEGGTKYNKFPKKWDFQNESGDFYKTKSATESPFFDIWHNFGELQWTIMKATATLMTYRERNWLQLIRNYSLVMYFAFKVDEFFVFV